MQHLKQCQIRLWLRRKEENYVFPRKEKKETPCLLAHQAGGFTSKHANGWWCGFENPFLFSLAQNRGKWDCLWALGRHLEGQISTESLRLTQTWLRVRWAAVLNFDGGCFSTDKIRPYVSWGQALALEFFFPVSTQRAIQKEWHVDLRAHGAENKIPTASEPHLQNYGGHWFGMKWRQRY